MRLNQKGRFGWVVVAGALGLSAVANAQPGTTQPRSVKAVSGTAPVSQSPTAPTAPTAPSPEQPAAPADAPPPGLQEAPAEQSGPTGMINPLLNNVTDFVSSGKPTRFPLKMSVLLDTSVGAGNFMLNPYARQPYVANTVRLQPRLTLWKSLGISARLDVTKEWISSYTQSTTIPNQITLGDLWYGASMPNIYTESFTGIGFGAGFWAFAPTSVQSRADTLITAVRPYVLVNWSKWNFFATYNFSVRKNFHEYVNPTVDARSSFNQECPLEGRCMWTSGLATGPVVDNDQTKTRVIGNRTLDLSRRNISHQIFHILSAGYTFFDQITPSATYMVVSSFRYPLEPDPRLSSPYARNNPWGHSDALIGVLDLTYAPFEKVAFSTGVFTFQPFFMGHRGQGVPGITQDGRTGNPYADAVLFPAFPFFDFFTPGNNYTSFYFDITLSI